MVKKRSKTMKKESSGDSWDKIGQMIGRKVGEEFKKSEGLPWQKHWMFCGHHEDKGGGFGRLLFIIAMLFILSGKGYLDGVATWQIVLLVFGFALMKL